MRSLIARVVEDCRGSLRSAGYRGIPYIGAGDFFGEGEGSKADSKGYYIEDIVTVGENYLYSDFILAIMTATEVIGIRSVSPVHGKSNIQCDNAHYEV